MLKIVLRSGASGGKNRNTHRNARPASEARHGARHQHEVVDDARPAVVAAVRREADRRVAGDRDRAADRADQHGVPDRAHVRRLVEELAEVVERQHVGEVDAEAPVGDEGAQRDARDRHDDGDDQPGSDQRDGDPFPAPERQRSRMRAALPLIVAYLRAFCSSRRCSSTSGIVIATMQTATAAIR